MAPATSKPSPDGSWTPDPRPEVWLALARWAKQHNHFDPNTIHFAKSMAKLLAADKPIVGTTLGRAKWLWREATHLGFNPLLARLKA
jgi:hypothetical protein